jgi:RNA polymerase-binding transcription factor DksA
LGWKDPETGEWEASDGKLETMAPTQDSNEFADKLEELQERECETAVLEGRRSDVKDALMKIETGTYGICEVCGEKIEEDRLEANPAARTCKAHM